MLTTPAYTQDVATFSDAELEFLSAEMQEAFETRGYDGDAEWTDDEAEARYFQMRDEKNRRHPRPPSPFDEINRRYIGEFLKQFGRSIELSAIVAGDTARADQVARAVAAGPKIGETVQIRKPYRFQS